jgi:serine/threonine protein kinase
LASPSRATTARATGAEAFLVTNGTTGVITGGGAAGTPAWMAPELFRDNAPVAGEASDAYSFGVVLWECLTGKTPWGWLRDPLQIVFAVAVEGKRLPFPLMRGKRRKDAEDATTRFTKKEKENAAAETEKSEDGFFLSGAEEATSVFFRALLERCWAEDPRARPGFEEIGEVLRGLRASVPRAGEARAEP